MKVPVFKSVIRTGMLLLCILLIPGISCKKTEKSKSTAQDGLPSSMPAMKSMDMDKSKSEPSDERIESRKARKTADKAPGTEQTDDRGLKTNFLSPMKLAQDRLLEYHINLSYECKNLLESRKALLAITAKYGFLKQSIASTTDKVPYVTADFVIKSIHLYDALIELESIGVLQSEHISVVDHTENKVLSDRKINREQIRIARKNQGMSSVAPGAASWSQIQSSLELSENELDQYQHNQWKIQDGVTWAKAHVYLKGPDSTDRLRVPLYHNALIGIANMLMALLYYIILLSPFIVAAGLVWLVRGKIKAIIARKHHKGNDHGPQ